jgi:hypothetical protein
MVCVTIILNVDKNGNLTKETVKGGPKWYSRQLIDEELKNFIAEALTGKENRKVYIGIVTHEAHQRIKNVCGKIMSNIMLESGTVRHAVNKPSHNLRENDLLLVSEIINTAKDIRLSEKTNQNNECLEFRKDLDGEITLVVEVRVNFGDWLCPVTIYRKKK